MQYMGGKAKIARRIVAAILADTDKRERWFEPFVGGGNVMEHAAPHFATSVGSDVHQDLILMWQHVCSGGEVPEFISVEEYQALKRADPSWLRGFVGFGASFGGRWFEGYGKSLRDGPVCAQSSRTVTRQGAAFRAAGTRFLLGSYADFRPPAGTVVYCDPPYAGTKFYSSTAALDYPLFYRTMMQWAEDCDVYVSEYFLPEETPSCLIWEHERRMTLHVESNTRTAVERLFRILPG